MGTGTRLVLALGGNAIAPHGTAGTSAEQTACIRRAAKAIAELVIDGNEPIVTHGNGPQVGNLLTKNELAADVVPPMPLDWCVAQTQATIGFTMVTALEHSLRAAGLDRPATTVISRVLVGADDPAFADPTKPIGRWLPERPRRVVASPTPVELLDAGIIELLLSQGVLVVAAGGGGIPMVRTPDGLAGVEAVVDKDRCAALLAETVDAERLVICTHVPGVATGFGTDREQYLPSITVGEADELLASGELPAGSMGPKVEACAAFVRSGGTAAIGSLDDIAAVVAGRAGTEVTS